MLKGPYKNGSMDDNLFIQNLIPKSQPYKVSPRNYSGVESVFYFPSKIIDWILIELRTNTDSASTISERAGFLKPDGSIVDLDGISRLGLILYPVAIITLLLCIETTYL